jgi:tRNA(adenine34) deaminase
MKEAQGIFDESGSSTGERRVIADERIMRAERALADERMMLAALELAEKSAREGEVPVGAVLVISGEIRGAGRNSPITSNDPTAHAEIAALRAAALGMGNYRLEDSTLYVTMEPCVMCAGAIVNARVKRLVFGARDLRFGGVRSKFRLADSELLNHRVEVVEGVLGAECQEVLQAFFRDRR